MRVPEEKLTTIEAMDLSLWADLDNALVLRHLDHTPELWGTFEYCGQRIRGKIILHNGKQFSRRRKLKESAAQAYKNHGRIAGYAA